MSTTIFVPKLQWKTEDEDDCTYQNSFGRCDYSNLERLEEVAVTEVYDKTLGFSRLYTAKGELLILATCYYGEGWSTCSTDYVKYLLMDSRIVLFFYNTYIQPLFGKARTCGCRSYACRCKVDEKPMADFLESIPITPAYLGGLKHLEISFVPPKTRFRVFEKDGCEIVDYFREEHWHSSS